MKPDLIEAVKDAAAASHQKAWQWVEQAVIKALKSKRCDSFPADKPDVDPTRRTFYPFERGDRAGASNRSRNGIPQASAICSTVRMVGFARPFSIRLIASCVRSTSAASSP